jgi:hypothetical protein
MMTILAQPVPPELDALRVTEKMPPEIAVPVIVPVLGLTESPGGSPVAQ